ncbi:MAG: phosphoadenosine phosphosulfate reductase family protein [Clostridia bacterium]|nr:phosphoadenosine phosphosulfate reductase family protein [Clostridia bacterium]
MKYIVSISFGKDSLAMLLMLLEKKMQIDEVIFFDTTMEFKAIYAIRDRIKKILETKNIKYTELKASLPFLFNMLEREVHTENGKIQVGYGMCGELCRWGTTEKERIIKRYLKNKYGKGNYKEYVGIASDEVKRVERKLKEGKLLPLNEWNMTEKDCLDYCYKQGYNWEETTRLYDVLDRVSCWCCANKNKKELNNMFRYLYSYYFARIMLLKQIKENNERGSKVVKKAEEQFIKMF